MNTSLTKSKPPHPLDLVRPPPLPQTFYVITIGEEVGIIEDVKMLAEIRVASEERFSMNTFTNWDRAAAYYKAEYDIGRVVLTSRAALTSHRNTLDDSNHIDLTIEPTSEDPRSKFSGLFIRKDSFSRMGSKVIIPVPFPSDKGTGKFAPKAGQVSSKPKTPSKLGEAAKLTGATRVRRKGPEKHATPTSSKDKPTYVYSSSDEEDVYGTPISPARESPALVPLSTLPSPAAALAITTVDAAAASLLSAATTVDESLANPADGTAPSTFALATTAADENQAPKRKYIKVYLPDGMDSFDPTAFERALRSLAPTEPTSGPSKPSKARKLLHSGAILAERRSSTTPFSARASSVPLITRIMDYVGLAPPINRHPRVEWLEAVTPPADATAASEDA